MPVWGAQIATQMLASFATSAQAIANAGQSLNDIAVANKSALDKTDEKKQATSKWLPSAKLFSTKIFGATQQQIRSKAPGGRE